MIGRERSLWSIPTGILLAMTLVAGPAAPAASAQQQPLNLRHTVVVDVVERTKDAVVYISTTRIVNRAGDDPFFEMFMGPRLQKVGSLGSGFIIHKDGYVVTNHHVIDRARQITVELLDGRKLPADLISSDAEADLAILKIASDKPLPTVPLGDSSDLMIGEPVIAVGNPLGYSHSVSTGIVSALHRDLGNEQEQTQLKDLIQTDAAINPGNSGGPLLNAYGQVIGINTAVRGDAQNIGFAIQVNRLRDILPDLMNPTHVNKLDMPVKLSESRKLTVPATVEPTVHLAPGNEVVKSIAGQKPRDIIDACAILLRQKTGQAFDIVTDKGTHSIKSKPIPTPNVIGQAKQKLGLGIEQMTPVLAEHVNSLQEDGIYVSSVDANSIAARAGIQRGDIITQIGQYRVQTLDEFSILLQHLPDSGNVYVGLVRGGRSGRTRLNLQSDSNAGR